MAIFAQCDFNDTDLTLLSAHTACTSGTHTSAATWAKGATSSGDIRITAAGRGQPTSGSLVLYEMSPSPADADYTVAATLYCASDAGKGSLYARRTATNTYYYAGFNKTLGRWEINKIVSGTTTQIGTTTAKAGLTPGTSYALSFDVAGSSLTLRVDGVVVATATDSAIVAAGKCGLYSAGSGAPGNENQMYQWDAFSADDVVQGAGSSGGGGGGGGTVSSGGRTLATHRVRSASRTRAASHVLHGVVIDTIPPTIVPGTILVTPGATTATVAWTTNESATSVVDYGTTSAYGTQATGSTGASHSVSLSSLTAATTYHYQITTVDAAGNTTVSGDLTFATSAVADTTAPVISAVAHGTATQTAVTITWTTDEASDSQVEYGATTAYGQASALDGTLVTSHSVSLTGLTQNTTYHYRVRSKDVSGNQGIGSDNTVATASPTPAPTISNVAASTVTSKTAIISGSVDVAATVSVRYGTVSGSLTSTTSTQAIAAGASFSFQLTGLTGSTPYYYSVRAVGAVGTTDSTQASFTTGTPAVVLSTMVLIGVDADTGVLGPYTDTDSSTTNPVVVTYNSIGVDLIFTRSAASDSVNDNPSAWARFKKAGDPNADWAVGVGGWRYHISDADAPAGLKGRVPRIEDRHGEKGFSFSFLDLDPGTTYECEVHVTDTTSTPTSVVVPFTATTWTDAIPLPSTLVPTHYVNYVTGLDSRTATQAQSKSTPWKTHGKAISAAPSGAVVELAPGFYPTISALPIRTAALGPITLKGEAAVVSRNSTTRVVSPIGTSHAVLCGAVTAAPSTAPLSDPYGVYTSAQVGPWQQIQVTGPRNGTSYTLWAWSAGLAAISQIGYGADRFGRFTRMQHINNPGSFTAPTYDEPLLNTPGGFAEVVNTSPTIFQASIVINSVLYMVWIRGDYTPNDLWWEASPASRYGTILRAPNSRVTQVHARLMDFGIDVGNTSADSSNITDVVIDSNLTDCCLDHTRVGGGGTQGTGGRSGNYPSRVTIQDNLFGTLGFRATDYTWQQWLTQWTFVKEYILRPSGMYADTQPYPGLNHTTGAYGSVGRVGGFMEDSGFVNGGCRQVVLRRNQFDGMFNGLTVITLNSSDNRHRGENIDGTLNLFTNVVDDNFEPEGDHTNIRCWNNWMDHTVNPVSFAPIGWGPYYYWRNVSWMTGVKGMGQFRDPTVENNASSSSNRNIRSRFEGGAINQFVKGQTTQVAMAYFVNNTHWTSYGNLGAGTPDEYLGCNGINESAAADASGLPNEVMMYLRNNIFRVTGYAARFGAIAGQTKDENYNLYVTTDTTSGLRINSGSVTGKLGDFYTATTPTGAHSLASYRDYIVTWSGRPVYMVAPDHTNSLGGSDIAFCGSTAVAAVDALFTDVTGGIPGLALKSGTNAAVDGGKAVCNVSDMPGTNVNGSAPDLGALER